jgi:NADH-quinone oxidoreductase subunit J
MNGEQLLFWLFALLACGGAVGVVVSQRVVRMALSLIVSLSAVSALFFMASADFVGAAQLMVYVGGTVVLLVFGVMLTSSNPFAKIHASPADGFLAAGIGAMFLAVITSTVLSVDWDGNALRFVQVSEEAFEAARDKTHHDDEFKSLHPVLDDAYEVVSIENSDVTLRRLRSDASLNSEQTELLTELWESLDLQYAPRSDEGRTLRPLGLALVGARPDRDQGAPAGYQKISDGYYTARSSDAALSNGYLLPFEIVSVHLLVVLIGAAYLARPKRRVVAAE